MIMSNTDTSVSSLAGINLAKSASFKGWLLFTAKPNKSLSDRHDAAGNRFLAGYYAGRADMLEELAKCAWADRYDEMVKVLASKQP